MTGGKVWAGDYGDGSVEGSAANLVDVLGIEVERGLDEGEGGGGGYMLALESTGIITQEADMGGTALVDARNGFNGMTHLEMMWTIRHCWTAGLRITFN